MTQKRKLAIIVRSVILATSVHFLIMLFNGQATTGMIVNDRWLQFFGIDWLQKVRFSALWNLITIPVLTYCSWLWLSSPVKRTSRRIFDQLTGPRSADKIDDELLFGIYYYGLPAIILIFNVVAALNLTTFAPSLAYTIPIIMLTYILSVLLIILCSHLLILFIEHVGKPLIKKLFSWLIASDITLENQPGNEKGSDGAPGQARSLALV